MIGRIDSNPDLRRGTRLALPLAIAALIVVGGLATTPSTILAQAPSKPRVRPTGIEPATPPAGGLEPVTEPVPAAPEQAPAAMPAPGSMALPTPADDEPKTPAPRDNRVRPAAFDDGPGLPPAAIPPGGVPPVPGPASGPASDPFALPHDRMGTGKQRVQLSVEVQASPIINLGKESTVRLVVKNESNVDASGVSLIYELPEGLKINSSTIPFTPVPAEKQLFNWRKEMLPANGEWAVVLKVVAISTRSCEHAATVSYKFGSRASTIVQEPKLKVEATAMPGRVLKGEQVTFQISVLNPGTGPARNVTVQAKLSSGLKYGGDEQVEQTIDEIGPGQRFDIEPLIVDSIAGGQQSCTVVASSADVTEVLADQRITRNVEVTKPDLAVKLEGQNERFTGQTNEYKLTVTNPGTAQAKKVKVIASLPHEGGKLVAKPPGATFDQKTRKLIWSIAQLEPLQSVEMTFVYATSTPGLYKATAEATSGELRASDTMTTDVSGIAVLDLQVSQTSRVMDVGKTNFYDITIKNSGTKEATRLQLSGNLPKNLKVLKHYNVEKGEFKFLPDTGKFQFPEIERLGVGQTITLSLEVQATQSGPAGCHIFLGHAEMPVGDPPIEDVISTTVTGNKARASGKP
jgi:uncharacterized repeat protein (TIGR01451 family)